MGGYGVLGAVDTLCLGQCDSYVIMACHSGTRTTREEPESRLSAPFQSWHGVCIITNCCLTIEIAGRMVAYSR